MLIFKIICIIILCVFIVAYAANNYLIIKDRAEGELDDDAAKAMIKVSWIVLIGLGCVLIYIIMN